MRNKTQRRLAVYLIIDTSESMRVDNAITAVNEGLAALRNSIIGDRLAEATLWLAVYAFDDTVRRIVPPEGQEEGLVSIFDFEPPPLDAAGTTCLSKALGRICEDIQKNYRPPQTGAIGVKGDYQPIVYLLTDGEPNEGDPWKDVTKRILNLRQPNILRYVVTGCGKLISDRNLNALALRNNQSGNNPRTEVFHIERSSIKKFFDWVSVSIRRTTTAQARGEEKFEKSPMHPDVREVKPDHDFILSEENKQP
jgi:uncharacterized protein YegL